MPLQLPTCGAHRVPLAVLRSMPAGHNSTAAVTSYMLGCPAAQLDVLIHMLYELCAFRVLNVVETSSVDRVVCLTCT